MVINKQFWNLSLQDQRSFIFNCVSNTDVKRKTTEESRRKRTQQFFITDKDGHKRQVCKTFFLTTLGFKSNNDKVIRNIISQKGSIAPKPDGRKSNGKKKKDRDLIIQHIESFDPQISHYRREHAPKRRYLPNDLTIRLMYDNFTKKYPDSTFSYYLYREVVASLNISFCKLGHEECWSCEVFKTHNVDHKNDNLDSECKVCNEWKIHHEKYTAARAMYQKDSEDQAANHITVTADLQKVLFIEKYMCVI